MNNWQERVSTDSNIYHGKPLHYQNPYYGVYHPGQSSRRFDSQGNRNRLPSGNVAHTVYGDQITNQYTEINK